MQKKIERKIEKLDEKFEAVETAEQKQKKIIMLTQKMKCFKSMHSLLRILGSLIMAFDLCCKISYYVFSSWLNIHVKNLYYSFICIRPIALSGLIVYNYIYAMLDIREFSQKG